MPPLRPGPLRLTVLGPGGLLSPFWARWVQQLVARLNTTPHVLGTVERTGLSAAIATTNLPVLAAVKPTSLYRISYYIRVTTAAATSSDLTVTIGWTEGGVSPSQAGALLNGNTTTTQQNGTFFVRAAVDTNLTYAVAYNSNPANAMIYQIYVQVEEVP